MRIILTDDEWNAIAHLTNTTKLDTSFDISYDDDHDFFVDFEDNDKEISLEEGLGWLYDGIAYPCQSDKLTVEEGELIADLLIEFGYANEKWKTWFLSKE